jgi:hypothetical protein
MAKDVIVKKSKTKLRILIAANLALIIGLAGFGGLYFKKYQDLKSNPPSATDLAQAEIDNYMEEVGKLYALPKDEKPQVATVKDKEKLKDQPFFAKAENNDVTLIYQNAKLAILYRPSSKQIVNVSTVTIQNETIVNILGPEADRNAAETKIGQTYKSEFKVSGKRDSKNVYTSPIVVDLSGQKSDAVAKLAQTLGGKVSPLPDGEEKPAGVDILIFVGQPAAPPAEAPAL